MTLNNDDRIIITSIFLSLIALFFGLELIMGMRIADIMAVAKAVLR